MIAAASAGPAWADGVLTSVRGQVEIGSGVPPSWHAARENEVLQLGQLVRTGDDGRDELRTDAGVVRLFESSLLRLPAGWDADHVDLEQGSSIFDIITRERSRPFEVRSPGAVVMVKGTRFTVTVEPDGTSVSVAHGLVGVRGLGASAPHEVLIHPGFTASGSADAPFRLSLMQPGADAWDAWSSGAALPRPEHPARSASTEARRDAKMAAHAMVTQRVNQLQAARDGAAPPAAAAPDGGEKRRQTKLRASAIQQAQEQAVTQAELAARRDVLEQQRRTALGRQMRETYLEQKFTGDASTGGLSIQLVAGQTGAGEIVIDGPGIREVLDQAQLMDIMQGNTQLLGDPLLNLLQAYSVPPLMFAEQLAGMF
jgi:hypothetical protein